ncbi:phage tail tape measure protein [Staphylococcus epidermidis]|uniref:phage tail tape measure protein n=1 Tax=Staphylococcus epidermidis TaxID=1282 RepID=UPI001EF954B6|nr:phage tail tape measure protein [Staphylococcus epidermidis]MCG7827307.1 phage tail tape measure protein [Staphylococcus epidermidis]
MAELKRAGIKLTAEGSAQYKADLKSATAALQQMAAESKRNIAALGQNASASKRYGLAIKDLGNTAKLAQAKLDVLNTKQKQLANSSRVYASEINKLENQLKGAKGNTSQLSSALAELRSKESLNNAELSRLNATIAKTETQMLKAKSAANQMTNEYRNAGGRFADVSEKMKSIGNNIDNTGTKAVNFGRTMTTRVTTPIVAGLGYAARAYVKFDDQMNQMKVQLDDGSVSAGKLKEQVSELGKTSQDMAKQYGVAGESIRNGMNELIKKGFTFNQVTGAMPSILKATVASGDDFNSVMSVSSSVLEQFGLKVDDTNQMIKNTDRVTSVLTYTANKTSAGFADLGEAMQNVGPMAANNNQSLEDMASTLGVLSNRGIEGGEAGTYLMNALQNLATPTKEQARGLRDLGVAAFDANGKMRSFPDILEDIEKATSGMSDEQKNAALNTIFNTQAMKGINPLIQAGSKSIKDLSKSTKDASKYQDDLSKKMGESASRNVAKMKESFKVLAETLGQQVVPAIIPLIDKATDLANKFGQLDKDTQGAILKIAAFAGAIGPLSLGLGSIVRSIGGTVKGIGTLARGFGKITSGASKVVGGAEKAAGGVSKFGSMAQKVGGFAPLLSNPYVLGFGAIVAASAGVGYLVYQNMHEDDNNHKAAVDQTKGKYQEWFDTVTNGASDAAGSQTKIQDATKKTGETYKKMTERLKKQNTDVQETLKTGWDGYEKRIEKTKYFSFGITIETTKHIEGLKEKLKDLGLSQKEISDAENRYKNYGTIIGSTFKNIGDVIGKHKKINSDMALATIKAVQSVTEQVVESINKEKEAQLNELKEKQELGVITKEQYQKETQSITEEYDKRVNSIKSNQNKIKDILSTAARENRELNTKEIADITQAYMELSEKTGQSISKNTEAQKFFSQNLREMVTESGLAALKQSGIIDDSTAKDIAKAKTTEDAIKKLKKALEDYDNKKLKEKDIKAKDKTTKEVKKADKSLDDHNKKKADEKELKAKDEISDLTKKVKSSLKEIDDLKVEIKKLKAKDEVSKATKKAENAMKKYKEVKADIKKLKAKDEASEKAFKAKIKVLEYNNAKAEKKILKGKDEITALTKKVKSALNQINDLKMEVKELKARGNASTKADEAKGKLDNFNNTKTPTKNLLATGNASPFTDTAQGKLNLFNGTGIPTKNLSANGNASSFTDSARNAVQRYNYTGIPTKRINVSSNAERQAYSAIDALNSIPRFVQSTINVVRNFFSNEHAEGGHIDAYAEGGNIQSHSVPGTYTGIVGEAGPEIFSVNRGNVTITPLNSREKMRGIEGVLQDYTNGNNAGNGVVVNINLNDTVIKEEADEDRLIRKMDQHLRRSLSEQQMIGGA